MERFLTITLVIAVAAFASPALLAQERSKFPPDEVINVPSLTVTEKNRMSPFETVQQFLDATNAPR